MIKKKIVIGSQKSIYAEFLINSLHNAHHPDGSVINILLPYMKNNNNLDINTELDSLDCIKKKQLYLLYSINFHNKIANWQDAAFQNIKRLSEEDVEFLFKQVTAPLKHKENDSFRMNIFQDIKEINIQKTIQELKKVKKKQLPPHFEHKSGTFRQ